MYGILSMSGRREVFQPLNPSLLNKLDPEYITYHNRYIQFVPPDESKRWDGSARYTPSLPPGGSQPVPVGEKSDIDLGGFQIRVYIPSGHAPHGGWPVFLWFHGGGWAIGGLDDSADFLTRMCRDARCVVVTVGYRLSPEYPFPAPLDDALASLYWIYTSPLYPTHPFNLHKISIGGTSAGGNIAIVLALLAAREHRSFPNPLVGLILIVPIIDNTAKYPTTPNDIWYQNWTSPWLTPARMLWYRRMYLPREEDWRDWRASPHLAPTELLQRLPRVWMAVSECDLLAPEAYRLADQVQALGVHVERYVVRGGTHSILALNGVLQRGRQLISDAVAAVRAGFGS